MAEGTEIPGSTPAVTPATVTSPTSPTATTQSLKVMSADVYTANQAVGAMDSAVGKGKVTLDEDAAEKLIKALDDAQEQVRKALFDNHGKIATELKFGNNPVADAISTKFREIAVGDETSATLVLEELIQILGDVRDTVKDAVDKTRGTDEDTAHAITKGAS
ncbi:hypothetical protein Lesp02_46960 [Lentzea sp. NBRC 105346]|uniref:hypothetical protein n=1 Tax=Lentzea sp. NBRC 105346 TaxID=3032205 RepID=UPI0024A4EA77|nr:hypothetical protein [Lentzea sp. NBRC 105346]GLZ32508.1 hypothetical protein Lesp02_46960 [Lentzea sp. NBRC 105346]